ncbi:hypothetical protein C3486_31840 [Streptomyces sp. Ru73]|nr:hypothetical protein C3486_31840 [Streptomyces sp. Ru73]
MQVGPVIHRYSATDADGRAFSVEVQRDFRYEPFRDFMLCTHCDWDETPRMFQGGQETVQAHLAQAHGADRGFTGSADEGWSRSRRIVGPVLLLLVIVLVAVVQIMR